MRKTRRHPREENVSTLTIAVGALAVHQIREAGSLNIGHTRNVRLLPAIKREPATPAQPKTHPEDARRERP
ncbi:hypothetical protein JCM14719A_20310 [Calditerricola satsumensis]|uniref:Uncharacterized protein n=1 Tax=Calditerricola satsumensis TaxID=373054 RepID=A0A8J3B8F5_9BACI|nr:hypothetical protein GCM10007043_08330 [Calditerricola satsumensis]